MGGKDTLSYDTPELSLKCHVEVCEPCESHDLDLDAKCAMDEVTGTEGPTC